MLTTITATELKNRISEVINDVAYRGNVTIVERHGKPLVKIVPAERKPKEDIKDVINRYFGAMPDFPDVAKSRRSRRRKIPPLLE